MIVEDMSYLIESTEREGTHYSQTGNPIRVKVLFLVTVSPTEAENPEYPFKHIFVKIPKHYPIYRVRPLLVQTEESIKEIYGKCVRIGFLIQKNAEGDWEFSRQLPNNEVLYV